jgi:hypothetical protein
MNQNSGVALALGGGFRFTKSTARNAEVSYWFACQLTKRIATDGVCGGRILPALILVSGPTNNMAFAVGQLAVFQGASDEHI